MKIKKREIGLSLMEVVTAASVLTMISVGAASFVPVAFKANEHSKRTLVSNQLFNQVMEEIQELDFQKINDQGTELDIPQGQNTLTLVDTTNKTVNVNLNASPITITGDTISIGEAGQETVYPRYANINHVAYRIDLVIIKGKYHELAALPENKPAYQLALDPFKEWMQRLNNFVMPSALAQTSGGISMSINPGTEGYRNTTSFNFSTECGGCPEEAYRTYNWNFGIGEGTSAQASPDYVFKGTGSKTVHLIVGDTRSPDYALNASSTVNIKDSQVNIAMTPSTPYAGQSVTFSATCAEDANLDCGTSPEFHWTFGDGSSATGASVSHSFSEAGDYTTSVAVIGGSDPVASQVLTVTPKLGRQALIEISPQSSGIAGPIDHADTTEFVFTARSEGYAGKTDEVTYIIDFGDGSEPVTIKDNNPDDGDFPTISHKYTTGGTYNVKLTASPKTWWIEDGTALSFKSATTSTSVTAKSQVNIESSVTTVLVGQTVNFNATTLGAGNSPGFSWDFGDGSAKQSDYSGFASHSFTKTGDYNVSVAVSGGSNPSASKQIKVVDANSGISSQTMMKKIFVKVAPWSNEPPKKYLNTSAFLRAQN